MNNRQIEKNISDAFNSLKTDQLETILSDCEKQERRMVLVNKRNSYESWLPKTLALATGFVLLFSVMFGYRQLSMIDNAVAATISLDVNPSIEIKINRQERVLDVKALNEDALIILDDMDFKGSDLKVTINALIGSLVRNGYINEVTNSILVSVQDSDDQEAEMLEEELIGVICGILDDGSVLAQKVNADDLIIEISRKYGITLGKAQMIRELVDRSTIYDYEDLAGLSINELNLLSKDLNDSILQRSGQPSDKAYIGMEKAKSIALNDLGVLEEDVYLEKIELDYEDRRMVYEVEFTCRNTEYEYVIDALTGDIIYVDVEGENYDYSSGDRVDPAKKESDNLITEAQAKAIALNDAGISEDQISYFRIEKEYDNGIVKYEIDFYADDTEYDYDIDAVSGIILKKEKELGNRDVSSEDIKDPISMDEAKNIAMRHAQVSDVYDMKADLDDSKYEISFKSGDYEYDYDISLDGTILKAEKERY